MKYKRTVGGDGDIEFLCKHGIGHSRNSHTCDDCNHKLHEM